MERAGGPSATDLRRPGRSRGTPKWFCLILVLCWSVPGAVLWSVYAFVPPSPDGWGGWLYSVPSLVSLAAELMSGALLVSWVTLPVLLLAVGFDYVRSAGSTRWRWRGAWMGAVGAGLALEVLAIRLAYPFLPPTPDWAAFAVGLGFLATGMAMIFVLTGAARSQAASYPRAGQIARPGNSLNSDH